MKRSIDTAFTEYRTNNCRWHYEIQNCIEKIEEQIKNHEARILSKNATEASEKWNLKFQQGKKTLKSSWWLKIQSFLTRPSIFLMRVVDP